MQYKPLLPELIFSTAASWTIAGMRFFFFSIGTYALRNVLVQLLLVQQMEGNHKISDGPPADSLKFK